MTGRGPLGGPPRRDLWRGVRDEAPSNGRPASRGSPSGPAEPVSPWVEVEELPTHALAPRSRSRVPLTGAVAIVALAALLAGGFGLLGGRPGATLESPQPASPVAGGPSSESGVTEPPAAPRVTPWSACSGPPDEPPEPVLEVDGRQYFGQVELLDFNLDLDPDDIPTPIGEDNLLDPVEVPMDAATEIWIVGGACAVAWNIALVGPTVPTRAEPQVLESVANEDRDPDIAAQNRFQVFVAPHAGDHHLRAILVLEQVAVRATWSIHVPPLEPPFVALTAERREIPTAIGCDVKQRLGNGLEESLSQCARDVGREPAQRVDVAPGEVLEFLIGGWAATNTSVYCGQLMDRTFVPRIEPSCVRDLDPLFAGARFHAPEESGPWTLAISTCATRMRITGSGFEELCGTWYANVRVRD